MTKVQTMPCYKCGKSSIIEVDSIGYQKWQSGTLIQKAFPEMPKESRELLLSGIHPECWNEMFKDSDDK